MAYLAGLLAAVLLGLGWVLQHHAALGPECEAATRPLLILMRTPLWWWGIASLSVAQTLGGWALQLGPISAVAPLFATNLISALLIRAAIDRKPVQRREIGGALLLCATLSVFVLVAGPHATHRAADNSAVGLATGIVTALAAVFVLAGIGQRLRVQSVLTAASAGLLYGLQDAATRGSLLLLRHSVAAVIISPWPYLLLASAAAAVLLTQRAFAEARLDYSLPPIAATQPVVGVVLGAALLGDEIALSPLALSVEAACLLMLVPSVVLIGRSRILVAPGR